MFRARKELAGYRLVADDAPRAAGQGHEISGPIGALPQLSGPGAAGLRPGQAHMARPASPATLRSAASVPGRGRAAGSAP
jgi:hypothetical protein